MGAISIVHTYTHDETKPAGTRARSLGDDDIREFKSVVRERLAIDHEFMADETGEIAVGCHKKITFAEIQAVDPTTYDNVGYLYLKDVSAVVELFWKDESGNVVQLTSGGVGVSSATRISILQTAYPVGCIYTSTVSTNPNTLFGFGTWEAFGTGRVLVGINGADADFDTAEETGGEKTHTLIAAEVPAHTHSITGKDSAAAASDAVLPCVGNTISTVTTSSAGGGGAHNNVQPYIVVYFFKRTA